MQWLMLQQPRPDDYVIATGRQFSVREFDEIAAAEVGKTIRWEGEGVEEHGVDANGRTVVRVDPRYFRPTEVESLLGDPAKAHAQLGWKPRIPFEDMVREMVTADLADAERDALASRHGYRTFERHE
jgi:GDPmannose 4,6-dehydratase